MSDSAGELHSLFFIVGPPRSGTTLVSRILDTHSRLAVYHESHYYVLFYPDLHRYGDLSRLPNLLRLIEDLREVIRVQEIMSPPAVNEFLAALTEPTFEGVLTTLLHLYSQRQGKMRGADKTPGHYAYLSEILEKFPQSPVIFVIRDPRDTVASLREAHGISLRSATWLWNDAFVSYRKASRPVHLVRYEELVRKPADAVEAMCVFLGEQYEPQMLRFFERIPSLLAASPTQRKLLGPVDPGSVGRFRQMSSHEIEWIESACMIGMEELGYPFITRKPKVVTISRPTKLNLLMDRVRYYRGNRRRRQRGWIRWKIVLRLRARYLFSLGMLREHG